MHIRFVIHVGMVVAIAGGVVQGVGAMESGMTGHLSEELETKVFQVVGGQANRDIFEDEELEMIQKKDAYNWALLMKTVVPQDDETFKKKLLCPDSGGATLRLEKENILRMLRIDNADDPKIDQLNNCLQNEAFDPIALPMRALPPGVKPLNKKKPPRNGVPNGEGFKKGEIANLLAMNNSIRYGAFSK